MEVLLVYLYGIYDSLLTLVAISTIIVSTVTGVFLISKVLNSSDLESDSEYNKKNAIEATNIANRFIYLKLSIFLIVLITLLPNKQIAVAMVATPHVTSITQDVLDSNRTKKLIELIDLKIEDIAMKLKEN